MILEVSSIIGYSIILWFSGYGSGKVFAFVETYFKRATGTY
jgi:nitrate/nitrite transporter NarK